MATRAALFNKHLFGLQVETDTASWENQVVDDEVDACFDITPEQTHETFEGIATMESLIDSLEKARAVGYPQDQLAELSRRLQTLDVAYPSLETFQIIAENATDVSMETLRQSIRESFKSILTMLARFWAQLTDFVYELSQNTVVLRTRLSLARSHVREIQAMSPKIPEIDVSRHIPQLSLENSSAKNPFQLLQNLSVLEHQLSLVRRQYIPMVLEQSQSLTDCFVNWSGDSPGPWLAQMNTIAAKFNPAAALGIHRTTKDPLIKHGDPLPGYRTIAYCEAQVPSDHSSGGSLDLELEWARFYQQRSVTLESTLESRDDETYEVSVWPQHMIEKVLLYVDSLIKEIDRCAKDDARHALRNLTLKLDKLARSDIVVPDGSTIYFHAGLGYIRTISKWTKEPYMAMITRATTVCNVTMRLCNMHTRAYTETPKTKEN